jgi:hypothetical protein
MSEDERRALLEKMQQTIAEAKTLTKEQARERLAAEGFTDQAGKLSPDYGGKARSMN